MTLIEAWLATTLGEVAQITIGRTPPRDQARYWTKDLTRPFCTIADMKAAFIDPLNEGVTEAAEVEGKAKRVPAGSLLMSFKLTIGKVGFAKRDLFPNEAIAWLQPLRHDLSAEFLALFLSGQDLSTGSGRAVKGNTLNGASLRAIPVRLPPVEEQRRIVDLVGAVDAQIEALSDERLACEQVYWAMRADLLTPQSDWWDGTLSDLAEIQVGFPFKSAQFTENHSDIRLLRGDNIVPGGLRWRRAKTWPKTMASDCSDYALEVGDTVVAMDRTWITSGLKIAVVSESDVPSLLVQRVARLTPKGTIPRELLPILLDGPEFESLVKHEQTGTSLPHISASQIRGLRLSLPSDFESQVEITTTLGDHKAVLKALEGEMAQARELRATLLSLLISGEVEIPETYDALLAEAV